MVQTRVLHFFFFFFYIPSNVNVFDSDTEVKRNTYTCRVHMSKYKLRIENGTEQILEKQIYGIFDFTEAKTHDRAKRATSATE